MQERMPICRHLHVDDAARRQFSVSPKVVFPWNPCFAVVRVRPAHHNEIHKKHDRAFSHYMEDTMRTAWDLLRWSFVSVFAALSCWVLPSWAQTDDSPALTAHPKTVEVAGQSLQRNGAGIRTKAIFKVYSAALYLEQPVTSLDEIAPLQGPKRMAVRMLRTINASELGKLFAHGMQDNMDKQQFSKLVPGVLRMSEVFSRHKELKPGDQFTLDWIPGKGMVLSVNGQPEPAEFPEPEFYQAMLGIWLGPKPADAGLKRALLGEQRIE